MTSSMRHTSLPHLVMAALICSGLSAASQQDPEALREYIRAEYPDLRKLHAGEFLAKAEAAGLLPDRADRIRAKRVLAELRRDKASGRGVMRFDVQRPYAGDFASAGGGQINAPGMLEGVAAELEYNDSLPYADALQGRTFVAGSIAEQGDRDYFAVEVAATAVVSAAVLPRGGTAIEDARLLIQNAAGAFVAFNDDARGSLFPSLSAILPAGSYRFAVDVFPGSSLGDYTLNLQQLPYSPENVTLGVLTAGSINDSSGQLFKLSLAESSQLELEFTPGPLDLRLSILREDNGLYYFVDDSSSGLDPNFAGELPAGEYYLLIDEFTGAAGAYSFQVDAIPSAALLVCDAAPVTGNITGAENYCLYSLSLASASELNLQVAPGAVNPLDDSVLDLLDADLQLIASNDDAAANLLSSLQTFLPAGDYFVALRGFGASDGAFSLSAVCSPLPSGQQGAFSSNPGATAPGEEALWHMSIKTGNPVELVLGDTGSHLDPRFTCVGSDGRRVLLNERGPLGDDNRGAGFLTVDEYMITVRSENNDAGGDFAIEIRPPLWIDESTPGVCRAAGHHKAEELVALFVGPSEAPPSVLFPMSLDGFLLLSSINPGVRFMFAPANGKYDFGEVPVVSCTIQGINFEIFDPSFFAGRWTDVINIVNGVISP